nr:uncharacterized protein LOC116775724 [Danaus plexippus plexippus]
MTTTKGKNASKLIKNFIKNLKKNTSAMRRLKRAYELHSNKNSIHELIKIINEKLDVVHKIRNDIKMYRTVNTVLTNHYIRETRDRERDIGGRMIDLEEQILRAYEGLRSDIMKIVASDRNVIAVTNNMYRNNEASDKKQIYDGIIRRIDGLFTGALATLLIFSGVPITPTEKRSHNKIITNGSLPRSVTINNPNFVQTTDGYYRFDTSHKNTNSQLQRNVSGYENFESPRTEPVTPVVSTENYENIGRMDEIGIPLYEDANKELSSPVMIRKLSQNTSPISSPYENVYLKNNMGIKPKSPNTQSPRTRIKTSFAHKNLPSPQYFIFPPTDAKTEAVHNETAGSISCNGIEEKLSLDDEIPMIDDLDITNDIELRHSKVERDEDKLMTKNKSFDDVKKELMADIPELEEFENDLNKRDKIQGVADVFRSIDIEENSIDSVIYESAEDLKSRYENLKEERRKLMAQIHDVKCKMTEIRSQEDDILRELEMEKALIKGEYDSEIAILNIEQKKKTELLDSIKKIEEDIRLLKDKQEARQKEMRDRVDIATMKVEKLVCCLVSSPEHCGCRSIHPVYI